MKLLLDTHILLWSQSEPEKLSPTLKEALEADTNEIWLSPVTTWEILMLSEKGRIEIQGGDAAKWMKKILNTLPFKEAPLNHEVAFKSRQIRLPHQDPSDRFLVATALVYGLKLVTADAKILNSSLQYLCFSM